jgi:hypothetical protein
MVKLGVCDYAPATMIALFQLSVKALGGFARFVGLAGTPIDEHT